MAESKKHHYVPQSMLKRFGVGKGQIIVLDKERNVSFSSSIVDAGSENHFNTINIDGKRINFEEIFQEIDSDFSAIQKKLLDSANVNSLTEGDLERLRQVIAVQILRTKLQRNTFQSVAEQLEERVLKAYGSRGGISVPDDNEARKLALQSLLDADDLVDAMRDKEIFLIDSGENEEFIISDDPVTVHNSFPYGLTGMSSPGAEIHLPLSPKITLALYCPTIVKTLKMVCQLDLDPRERKIYESIIDSLESGAPATLGEHTANFLNTLQLRQSARFLYGSSFDSLAEVKQKISEDSGNLGINSRVSIGELGKAPISSRMPPGEWLVFHTKEDHGMFPVVDISTGNEFVCSAEKNGAIDYLVSNDNIQQVSLFRDGVEARHMKQVKIACEKTEKNIVRISFRHRSEGLNQILGI